MRLYLTLFFSLLLVNVNLYSQDQEMSARKKLVAGIDFHHLSAGIEGTYFKNSAIGIQLSWGLGSYRSFYGIDCGVRYRYINPLPTSLGQQITMHSVPVFISGQAYVLRTRQFGIYLGPEAAFNFIFSPSCRFQSLGSTILDKDIGQNHISSIIKIGIRTDHYDFSLFCEYDMQPAMNQKYLFESTEYDYTLLRSSIRERIRFGIRISYIFIL